MKRRDFLKRFAGTAAAASAGVALAGLSPPAAAPVSPELTMETLVPEGALDCLTDDGSWFLLDRGIRKIYFDHYATNVREFSLCQQYLRRQRYTRSQRKVPKRRRA